MFARVAEQFCARSELEPLENLASMGLDGPNRHVQATGDLDRGSPLGQKLQNLPLPFRELGNLNYGRKAVFPLRQGP